MEIQFSIDGNPPRLAVTQLRMEDIDRVIQKLDVRIASLLKDAAKDVWTQMDSSKGSREISSALASAIDASVAERAPQMLNVSFCGKKEDVGTAVVASLSTYFMRSLDIGNGKHPEWLEKLSSSGRSNGGQIVMTAVALKLAGISFDVSELIGSFDR